MGPVNGQSVAAPPASRQRQPGKKQQAGGARASTSGEAHQKRGAMTLSTRRIRRNPELKQWRDIAMDTLSILNRKVFDLHGQTIDLTSAIDCCIRNTVCYGPGKEVSLQPAGYACAATRIEVTQETSLEACSRICRQEQQKKKSAPGIACLNFASAVSPGGMFLDGTNTQEDCLARSSALYASLTSENGSPMYQYNRAHQNRDRGLHSDAMIYSPDVPVFRDDDGNLRAPYRVSFITAPAVDRTLCAGVAEQAIQDAMQQRARKVLVVAANHGVRHLILGAWGCGIFGHSGADVAKLFSELLAEDGINNRFVSVTFPVTDPILWQAFASCLTTS